VLDICRDGYRQCGDPHSPATPIKGGHLDTIRTSSCTDSPGRGSGCWRGNKEGRHKLLSPLALQRQRVETRSRGQPESSGHLKTLGAATRVEQSTAYRMGMQWMVGGIHHPRPRCSCGDKEPKGRAASGIRRMCMQSRLGLQAPGHSARRIMQTAKKQWTTNPVPSNRHPKRCALGWSLDCKDR